MAKTADTTDTTDQRKPERGTTEYPSMVQHEGIEGMKLYDACQRELQQRGYSEDEANTLIMLAWNNLSQTLRTSTPQ